MKKLFIIMLMALAMAGCSTLNDTLDVTNDILGIFYDDPVPAAICDKDTAGTEWNGRTCLKTGANSYQWVKKEASP